MSAFFSGPFPVLEETANDSGAIGSFDGWSCDDNDIGGGQLVLAEPEALANLSFQAVAMHGIADGFAGNDQAETRMIVICCSSQHGKQRIR